MHLVQQYARSATKLADATKQIDDRINKLQTTMRKHDLETEDLLHLLEFGNFNAAEGYKISRMIKIARQKRRAAKNEWRVLCEIKRLSDQQSPFESQVEKLHEVIQRETKRLSKSKYKLRVRSDLKPQFDRIHKQELAKRK